MSLINDKKFKRQLQNYSPLIHVVIRISLKNKH